MSGAALSENSRAALSAAFPTNQDSEDWSQYGLEGVGSFVVPAGAGDNGAVTTLIVKKVVTGPATDGSSVKVQCSDSDEFAVLNFDATGAPSTTTSNVWTKVNGAWELSDAFFFEGLTTCTFTETVTGGAESTSWTCAYAFTEPDVVKGQAAVDPEPGCAAPAGTGAGPASVVYGTLAGNNIATQTSTVTFTNTYAAPQVVDLQPNFTG